MKMENYSHSSHPHFHDSFAIFSRIFFVHYTKKVSSKSVKWVRSYMQRGVQTDRHTDKCSLSLGLGYATVVWKSQIKSHSTLWAKQATFTFWVGKSSIKMTKKVNFGEFLKSLRSNSVIRQVTFNRTKIDEKCQQMKSSYATFWVIFKHCERADWTLKHCIIEYTSRSAVYALDFLGKKLETLVFHQHVLLPHEEAL